MHYCSVRAKYSTTKTWNIFSKSVTTLSFISNALSQALCQQEGNGTEIRWRILTPEKKNKNKEAKLENLNQTTVNEVLWPMRKEYDSL